MRPSSNTDVLLRSNEILLDMIDTLLHESYVTPEMMLSFTENYHRCKKAHDAIKFEHNSKQQSCFVLQNEYDNPLEYIVHYRGDVCTTNHIKKATKFKSEKECLAYKEEWALWDFKVIKYKKEE